MSRLTSSDWRNRRTWKRKSFSGWRPEKRCKRRVSDFLFRTAEGNTTLMSSLSAHYFLPIRLNSDQTVAKWGKEPVRAIPGGLW
jgi:hypothetical protein